MSKGSSKRPPRSRSGTARRRPADPDPEPQATIGAPDLEPEPEAEPAPEAESAPRAETETEEHVSALVAYADGDDASAFAQMLGGLIAANVESRPEKRPDFDSLRARVGIEVEDIEEAVTLDFEGGHLTVHNGLKPRRHITIGADADTVMQLSNLRIGPFGMPIYFDQTGRGIVGKILTRKLRIDGIPLQIEKLNKVTRLFSVM